MAPFCLGRARQGATDRGSTSCPPIASATHSVGSHSSEGGCTAAWEGWSLIASSPLYAFWALLVSWATSCLSFLDTLTEESGEEGVSDGTSQQKQRVERGPRWRKVDLAESDTRH